MNLLGNEYQPQYKQCSQYSAHNHKRHYATLLKIPAAIFFALYAYKGRQGAE